MAWGETPAVTNPDDMVEVGGKQFHRNSPEVIAARDTALATWEASQAALATAKADEMAARKEVVRLAFDTVAAREGVNRTPLHNGYNLKYSKKLNYKVAASNTEVEDVEDKMPTLGNEATFLFERIITWRADFSKSEYNKLDSDNPTHKAVKAEIDKLLEITEGAPTLAIEEPKGTKK